jgi:hypothetical protein
MLLGECEAAGVEISTRCEIESVAATPGESSRYLLDLVQAGVRRLIACNSLVVATGALSIPTLGGSGQGYEIARQFGLELIPRRAGLVPFMFTDATLALCERLAGISLEVTACCNGRTFSENMLFTHRGISGPAILQISNYWHPGDPVSINLLPGMDAAERLIAGKSEQGKVRLNTLLHKHLPRALVAELQTLWWPGLGETPLGGFSDRQLALIGGHLNGWLLKPSATEGYRTAEVTLGGVDTDGISSKTMEARQHPGLFFVGEVMDVSGHLGGFNFQWAWSSGYIAGSYA